MTELEKCNAGLWYHTESTGLGVKHLSASDLCAKFNRTRPSNIMKRQRLLQRILGRMGVDCYIEPYLQCSYGFNLEVGDHFFAETVFTILKPSSIKGINSFERYKGPR